MPAILFDLDGVLYEGDYAIAGAAETIEWFNQENIPHLFLTNTSSKPRSALVEKLSGFGIHTKEDQFFTPPVAASNVLLKHNKERVALFIPESTKDEFSIFTLCDEKAVNVDAVVVGDLSNEWSFERLNYAFTLLKNNPDALFIALGMTRYWKSSNGLQLDAGPFVKALEYATGRQAVVTGKPAAEFYQTAISKLNNNDEVVMIGDDIHGDIEAAQKVGLKAIQVETGKFTVSDISLDIHPDARIASIAKLKQWWREKYL